MGCWLRIPPSRISTATYAKLMYACRQDYQPHIDKINPHLHLSRSDVIFLCIFLRLFFGFGFWLWLLRYTGIACAVQISSFRPFVFHPAWISGFFVFCLFCFCLFFWIVGTFELLLCLLRLAASSYHGQIYGTHTHTTESFSFVDFFGFYLLSFIPFFFSSYVCTPICAPYGGDY